jgi:hypothetical protein
VATSYWQLVEPVWDTLVQWDSVPEFQLAFKSAEPTAGTLFAAHWLYSEVCNGGFYQFYWNATGILAPEAKRSYELIGMPRTADVIQRSMQWFPTPYPRDREARVSLLQVAANHGDKGGPFRALDDTFYKVVESECGGFVSAANDFAARKS